MAKNKLKFEEGFPVIIELIEAEDQSKCRFGYKVGDAWEVSSWENSELCGFAYNAFFPFITMLQCGGEVAWKASERDQVIRSCPDLRPGFRFMIRRK